jgi:hypothetical protein
MTQISDSPQSPNQPGKPAGPAATSRRRPTVASALSEEVLDRIWKLLSIEEEWAVREPWSLTWWAHRLAQRIRISKDAPGGRRGRLRVSIETDCLRGLVFDHAGFARADAGNRLTTLAGFTQDPSTGRLFAASTAYVRKENIAWQKIILGLTAGLSATRAHGYARGASEWGPTAQADESAHPVNGFRPDEDDILWVPAQAFKPHGAGESLFIGGQMSSLLQIRPRPWVLASGGPTGITAEFPFWGYQPAGFVSSRKGPETALLQVTTNEKNPTYGSGALLRLSLPLALEGDECVETAARLNLRETTEWTGFDHFGAWCANPRMHSVTYVTFLPSGMHDQVPVVLRSMVWNMAARAKWAAGVFGECDA